MNEPARLVVCASGGGRTLENLAERIAADGLPARIELVVLSKPGLGAEERARRLGLPTVVVGRATHPDPEARREALLAAVRQARPDWVLLAGWLSLFPIPPELEGRVLNVHPALLPAHGGRGCYGMHVHRAVAAWGEAVSGCTVHFADDRYDQGAVIVRQAVPLPEGADAETIAARVFEAEKRAYPEALGHVLAGRVRFEDGRAVWRHPGL